MKRSFTSIVVAVVLGLLFISQSVFIVDQRQRGLVLQLGKPVLPVREPGLHFKIPFIQNVVLFENRIQTFVMPRMSSQSVDGKTIEIDNYVCWRIVDPLSFYKNLNSGRIASERLKDIVEGTLKAAIGKKTLQDVINRVDIMEDVLKITNAKAAAYGVDVVDVRIRRSELPAKNREAILDRMRANMIKQANEYRAQGEARKLDIQSSAEKERDIIIAEARKEGMLMRGSADAKSIEIFAEALSKAPEFYDFTKSLEVYKKGFKNNTKVILSSEADFLKYLKYYTQ